ncbi:hypothetical protein [Spelaeicoccus albus]|uniref:Uncharacterized protein n=1 Tax=Spelaeicoccus albus TaxID=1280376 RepID=A0A7Z0D3M6_9MICO|nr:hypothetical protein [Spelaeicoccus albus]NYI68279.1 hypothetical protein [Spelaeicoccus albus]
MSFSTLIAFAQDSGAVAGEIAEDFSADGSEWSKADIVNLPRYSAAIRTNLNQQRQSAFTVHIEHFEADRRAFATRQGYEPTPSAMIS